MMGHPCYPLWVVSCEDCGFVCTVWEKPGTACSYMEHCPSCGLSRPETHRVEDVDEHRATKDDANDAAWHPR